MTSYPSRISANGYSQDYNKGFWRNELIVIFIWSIAILNYNNHLYANECSVCHWQSCSELTQPFTPFE